MTIRRRDARSPVLSKGAARTAAAFLCAGLSLACLPGSAGAATAPSRQTYSLSEFDTVRLEAPVEVVITTGKGVSASGTGDRDTLDQLDLQVNGRTLAIRIRSVMTLGGSGDGGKARRPTRIVLTTGELHRLTLLGSGTLTADAMKGARADIYLSGSGRLTVARVEADRVDAGLLGSGTLTLAGTTLDLMATVSGSGRMDAGALTARRVRAQTEGSVDARMSAAETANVTANGSGQIEVAGKAVCTVRKIGSAGVTCGGEVF